MTFFKKIFGDPNKKVIEGIHKTVETINGLEEEYEKYSDKEIKEKAKLFKGQFNKGKTLDDILPHAFATVRESSKRVIGMRHYDDQLIG